MANKIDSFAILRPGIGMNLPENSLIHYGVKGMKWGVRRSPEELGHHKKVAKKLESDKMIVTISGHKSSPKEAVPNSVMENMENTYMIINGVLMEMSAPLREEI